MSSNFAEELRSRRLDARLSQEELAEAAQVSASAIGAYERGTRKTPHRQTVIMLADALRLKGRDRAIFEASARSTHRLGPKSRTEFLPQLPDEPGTFFGDENDLRQIAAALQRHRLVTLVGTGGVGKSRSALRVAKEFFRKPCGVRRVDAAALQHGSEIAPAIALATAHLRDGLLILDNCEHVITDVSAAVGVVLRSCPSITVLATSRERLRIAGEMVHVIAPLRYPEVTPSSSEAALSYPSVALFVERASISRDSLNVDRDREAITEICRFLGGVPLAIELVASQVRALGIPLLRDQLRTQFSVLSSGNRDLPARQQTLHATLSWSYNLLGPLERLLYRRLATFPEPFTAREVFGACTGPDFSETQALNALAALVDKSMVWPDDTMGESRYCLLAVARLFALEKAIEAGELLSNIRSAMTWALGSGASPRLAASIVRQLSLAWVDDQEKLQFLNWLGTALANIDVEEIPKKDLEACWLLLAEGLDEVGQPLRAGAARNCADALAQVFSTASIA